MLTRRQGVASELPASTLARLALISGLAAFGACSVVGDASAPIRVEGAAGRQPVEEERARAEREGAGDKRVEEDGGRGGGGGGRHKWLRVPGQRAFPDRDLIAFGVHALHVAGV